MASDYKDRSVLIHGKFRSEKWDFEDHILPPITTSASFRLRNADRGAQAFQQFANPELDRATLHPIYIYERLDEPCQGLLEETLAFAEKGETAVAFATGMAAISAIFGIHLRAGEHLLMHNTVYGCTYSLVNRWLKRFGVANDSCDFTCIGNVAELIRPETRVVYFESPCNPTMEVIDIESITALAAKVNANRPGEEKLVVVMDNTFATPYCQRPLTMGVDFVVHSLTKNLGGFGADMGGAVIGRRTSETDLLLFRKDFGGAISPKAAWQILVYGIPTLALRLERQQRSAMEVAQFLESHPKVSQVRYPGLASFPQSALAQKQMRDFDGNFAPGSVIYFEVGGPEPYEAAKKVANHVAKEALSITLAVSLGQIRTLIEHPASMTHSAIPPEEQAKAGINPGGLRLSLGIEDVRDIIVDLGCALDSVA